MSDEAGVGCEYAPLRAAVMKRPEEALVNQYLLNERCLSDGWLSVVEYNRTGAFGAKVVKLVQKFAPNGLLLSYLDAEIVMSVNSIFVRDSALMFPNGTFAQCSLHNPHRLGEPHEVAELLQQLFLDLAFEVTGEGQVCGSDFVWLSPTKLMAGLTNYLTNEAGLKTVKDEIAKIPDLASIEVTTFVMKGPRTPTTATAAVVSDASNDDGNAVSPTAPTASSMSGDVEEDTRLCLVSALSILSPTVAIFVPSVFEDPDSVRAYLASNGVTDLIEVSLDQWRCGAAEIFVINPKNCLVADSPGIDGKLVEEIQNKSKMTLHRVPDAKETVRSGRAGITSMILPLLRRD